MLAAVALDMALALAGRVLVELAAAEMALLLVAQAMALPEPQIPEVAVAAELTTHPPGEPLEALVALAL